MYKSSFYVLSAILSTSTALASSLNCNGHPSCEAMGYSKTGWEDCTATLSCLYDPSYKVCIPQCNNDGDDEDDNPVSQTCPEGTMLAADCRSEHNGVLQRTSIDANGCGICLPCDGELHLAGEITSIDQLPYTHGYEPLNYSGSIGTADLCLKPCRCPENSEVVDPSQTIKSGGGNYCLTREVYFAGRKSGSYTFYKASAAKTMAGCSGKLIIDFGTIADSVTSYVYTTVRSSSDIKTLTLFAGGKFEGAMSCGLCYNDNCNGDGSTCKIYLEGGQTYDFSEGDMGKNDNQKPAVVYCNSIDRIFMGHLDPSGSGFLFSGSHKGLSGGNCEGKKCHRSGKYYMNKFTDSNTCESSNWD